MSLHPLPNDIPNFLEPYLPPKYFTSSHPTKPFVTLTYAQSLDSKIASKPGTRTTISHLETKTMTHYLRSKHDAILVGSHTALIDDPGLNCRLPNCSHPRPIILDPSYKWDYKGSKLESSVEKGESLTPWIIVSDSIDIDNDKGKYLQETGGKFIKVSSGSSNGVISWDDILTEIFKLGISSIMVEGGAYIINQLLTQKDIVDSVIITIGPVFLGKDGVDVSPPESVKLHEVKWWHGIQDSIIAGRLQ